MLVESGLPKVAVLYQAIEVPAGGVAVSKATPGPHLETPIPDGAAGNGFTVAITAVLAEETHPVRVVFDST